MPLQGFCIGEVENIKPIPKKLLIHAVTCATEGKKDRWGECTDSSAVRLSFVRLEPSSKVVRDKNNAEVRLAAVLFYDCVNSRPSGFNFAVDQIIDFNGDRYRIQIVEPLYDGQKLHHYEMGLIKHAKSNN